jgi:hypothetical protein
MIASMLVVFIQKHHMSDAADAPSISSAPPRTRLPNFTFHGSSHWTVRQILEAFTQIAYTTVDFVPGKGHKQSTKKTTLSICNAHVIQGVLAFFEHAAAEISTSCPAFLEKQKTISKETLRSMWEKKLAYRIQQRLSWGKGHNLFHRSGDGDFPNLNSELGMGNANSDEKFELAFQCAQIDDILDSHLQALAEQESNHRNQAGAAVGSASGSALGDVESNALVVFQNAPAAHSFGQPLRPPAHPGQVAAASTVRRGQQSGGASLKRPKTDDKGAVEQVLDFGSSVTELGAKIIAATAKPTVEQAVARTTATTGAMVQVLEKSLTSCIKEFKKPTVNSASNSLLSRMATSDLIRAIKNISKFWAEAATLHDAIQEIGLNGKAVANMQDEELKAFLIESSLSSIRASILIAEMKSWSQMDLKD